MDPRIYLVPNSFLSLFFVPGLVLIFLAYLYKNLSAASPTRTSLIYTFCLTDKLNIYFEF